MLYGAKGGGRSSTGTNLKLQGIKASSIVFSHRFLKIWPCWWLDVFPHSKYFSKTYYAFIILFMLAGECSHCDYAGGQIQLNWVLVMGIGKPWFSYFSHLNQNNGCGDKWDVCIYSLVNGVFCAVKMNAFPYCFLARNDASCSHPPYSLPSVSDAFGQIDRLHFSW